jgi:Elongation factor Tu GTP binding domain
LSDALLLKAGLLHSNRAGDQTKGRSPDKSKDERERGITIKSAAVTLEFAVKERVLSNGPYAQVETSKETDLDMRRKDMYIGKLPHNFTVEEVQSLLADHGIKIHSSDIRLSTRRSYAVVGLPSKLVPYLLTLDSSVQNQR